MEPLAGIKIVSIAFNLPGPAAASKLQQYGAQITKIEPPSGDPLAKNCPQLYRQLVVQQSVLRLDLKNPAERSQLDPLLETADVLLTSSLPASLERLGLAWPALHQRFPRLCQVSIIGYQPPHENRPGHDLTYQSTAGLIRPGAMPRTLVADMSAAQTCVTETFAVLAQRQQTGEGCLQQIPISGVLDFFTLPLQHHLTTPPGPLSGTLPNYNLYPTRAGWLSVAALESHFWQRLQAELCLTNPTYEQLQAAFAEQTAAEWEQWGRERNLPLSEVKQVLPA